ncbi:Na(+)-translocating NADH-quinone reductase, A subunit family protein [Treponema vincentii ATCC 35580]|uniref:Na(+)-translocating NADH-quinone reductase, A subunit family protein n=1 Tax=Treponema vincentii ATCC 35580 TaxID=596324 RepID=C8PN84_9SPIR|nr:Na(+)-translocating NADH-quinone reductase, A subunit family protein [Treponema vincentii ATCC 35580]
MPSTKMVWIPVTQGGAPNTPLVKVGDTVVRGQKMRKRTSLCLRRYMLRSPVP